MKFLNKESIQAYWRQNDRLPTLYKSLLLGLLPLACALLYCLFRGKSIGDIYLPDSLWNDELFYFEQVESILAYGYPRGYFGFNESHAMYLSFAAWSPVLVFPWVLWGLFFGWNMLSPILCNIFLLCAACFAFVWLVKPSWKKVGVLAALFCLYTPFTRYMLSAMPEIICFSMMIVFYGLALNYLASEKTYKLVLLFVMSGLMTLMRPYLLLFVLLPALLWILKGKWKAVFGSAGIVLGILGVYAAIHYFLSAEYTEPLFYLDWLTVFFEKGILEGIRYDLGELYYSGKEYLGHTIEGIRSGFTSGTIFAGHFVILVILVWESITEWKKTHFSKKFWLNAHLVFAYIAMFFAQLLMYNLTDGSKHFLTFLAVGIFFISMLETKYFRKAILLAAALLFLFNIRATHDYDYQVPFRTEARAAQMQEWKEVFDETIVLNLEDAPTYDNVVVWVFSDQVEGKEVLTAWQVLYALPTGTGISCCLDPYVTEHLEEMVSKYLLTLSGAEIDTMCQNLGYKEVHRDADVVLYQRY
jgi:hypothetical protein